MLIKENTAKANALIEEARAEMAAKRKVRETRFADTVMGWENGEEPERPFPPTVAGWEHPAVTGDNFEMRLAALLDEEKAIAEAQRVKARRMIYGFIGVVLAIAGVFIAIGFARVV